MVFALGFFLQQNWITKFLYLIKIFFFMKSITPNILNIFTEKNITNEMNKKQQKFINQLYLHYNI